MYVILVEAHVGKLIEKFVGAVLMLTRFAKDAVMWSKAPESMIHSCFIVFILLQLIILENGVSISSSVSLQE